MEPETLESELLRLRAANARLIGYQDAFEAMVAVIPKMNEHDGVERPTVEAILDFVKKNRELTTANASLQAERDMARHLLEAVMRERDDLLYPKLESLQSRLDAAEKRGERYRLALEDIAQETGTPYARVASAALAEPSPPDTAEGAEKP